MKAVDNHRTVCRDVQLRHQARQRHAQDGLVQDDDERMTRALQRPYGPACSAWLVRLTVAVTVEILTVFCAVPGFMSSELDSRSQTSWRAKSHRSSPTERSFSSALPHLASGQPAYETIKRRANASGRIAFSPGGAGVRPKLWRCPWIPAKMLATLSWPRAVSGQLARPSTRIRYAGDLHAILGVARCKRVSRALQKEHS
jgi:hypothetical protein